MKTLITFLSALLPLMAFAQAPPILRNEFTTNTMMNAVQDGWFPVWNNTARKWSNTLIAASATNAMPPSTTLTNLSQTGAITNLNDNQFADEATIAAIKSGAKLTNLEIYPVPLQSGYGITNHGHLWNEGDAIIFGGFQSDGASVFVGTVSMLDVVNLSSTLNAVDANFLADVTVPPEAYGIAWDGNFEVPTKDALYDKIQTLSGLSAFNVNQFSASSSFTNIKSSPLITNIYNFNSLIVTGALAGIEITTGTLGQRWVIDPVTGSLNYFGTSGYIGLNSGPYIRMFSNGADIITNFTVFGTNDALWYKISGGVPAGSLLRTDSNTNIVAATVGAGLSFDGTTVASTTAVGGTGNGQIQFYESTPAPAHLDATNTFFYDRSAHQIINSNNAATGAALMLKGTASGEEFTFYMDAGRNVIRNHIGSSQGLWIQWGSNPYYSFLTNVFANAGSNAAIIGTWAAPWNTNYARTFEAKEGISFGNRASPGSMTTFDVPDNWKPTNLLRLAITNAQVGDILKVHSVTMSGSKADIVMTNVTDAGGSGLFNTDQFAASSTHTNIKIGVLLTNASVLHQTNRGAHSFLANNLTLMGTNLFADGTNATLFTNAIAANSTGTGLTNVYVTNIMDGQTISMWLFPSNGTTIGFPQFAAADYTDGAIIVPTTNSWNLVQVTKRGPLTNIVVNSGTYAIDWGNLTATTNFATRTISLTAPATAIATNVNSLLLTNQIRLLSANFNGSNGVSAVAVTNLLDTSLAEFKAVTNRVGTNWTGILTNYTVGSRGIMVFEGLPGFTNNIALIAASAGTNHQWMNWETNGNYDIYCRGGYTYQVKWFVERQTNVIFEVGANDPFIPITDVYIRGTNYVANTTVSNNISYITALLAGNGNGSSNYALSATMGDRYINGAVNVHIASITNTTLGRPTVFTLVVTNGGGGNTGINFSAGTNNWKWSYAQGAAAPSVLTNLTQLLISGRVDGSNVLASYAYYAWP